jgi:glycosyltransferase involved in cell wall biosynthesis
MPHASIIVPAFNAAQTLSATLESLISQSFRDMEIIVVDDGSTDRTAKMAERFTARDPRIRFLGQPNRGPAGARNTGIAAASGDVIGFCNGDDLWAPDKLATHVAHLGRAPHVGLSYSGSALITPLGQTTGQTQRPRLRNVTAAHVFKRNPVGNASTPVFRRGALNSLAWRPRFERRRDWIFDETFRQSEDIECWLRLSLATDWAVEGVPGLLVQRRSDRAGLATGDEPQFGSWERMVTKLRPQAPDFFARHETAARAYRMLGLAQRAALQNDGVAARAAMADALRLSWTPLREEPLCTVAAMVRAQLLNRCNFAVSKGLWPQNHSPL